VNNFKWSGLLSSRVLFLAALVLFLLQTGVSNSFADNIIRKAQSSMLLRGINPGPVDGIWGPRTQRGVWAYQEWAGLPVTGKLDAATKNRLFTKLYSPSYLEDVSRDEEERAKARKNAGKNIPAAQPDQETKAAPVEKPKAAPVEVAKAAEPEKAPAPPAPAPKAEPEKAPDPAPAPAPKAAPVSAGAMAAAGDLPAGFKISGKYTEGAVSNGGSISGVIKFAGTVPPPIMEDLSKGKNVEFCSTHPDTKGTVRPRQKVVVANGMLKDAVVFIQNIESGKAWKTEVENFDFKTCDIFPKVSVIRKTPKGVKEGLLTITNQDENTLHNPHGYSVAGANRKTLFNKPLPSKGSVADVTGTFKRFKAKKDKHFFLQCDQHNYMEADARVIWNPYYSISGEDGSFKIDQIPAGKYWVTVWHPYVGETSSEITISGGKDENMSFQLAIS
jgi:peptidoglycan hydrolase-like protein with peptidoglycan-binding domain